MKYGAQPRYPVGAVAAGARSLLGRSLGRYGEAPPGGGRSARRRMRGLRERQEWQFFQALPRADRRLAAAWWAILIARGVLPAGFAVTVGVLVAAVQRGHSLAGP